MMKLLWRLMRGREFSPSTWLKRAAKHKAKVTIPQHLSSIIFFKIFLEKNIFCYKWTLMLGHGCLARRLLSNCLIF